MKIQHLTLVAIVSVLSLFAGTHFSFAQGLAFRGAGAVNESMGGAATACPLSATGALYWNPATMSAFQGTTVDIDLGLAMPETTISSQLPASMGGLGGGVSESDSGAVPLPNVAIIRNFDASRWTFGFSFGAVGGAKTNYTDAALTDNPILSGDSLSTPAGPMRVGYGNLNSTVQILQIGANLSCAVTEKFSVSFGPTITMANLNCDPLYIAGGHGSPDSAIRGCGDRYIFGGGFQVGFYYDTQVGWSFGGSYKSKGWLEKVGFRAGRDDDLYLDLGYPAILSLGTCWYGWEKWIFALDLRYFFHEQAGFDMLGWRDMVALSLGVQRIITDRLSLRVGYSVNENQLDSSFSRASIGVPLIPQHALFLGGSFKIDPRMTLHATYGHIFKASSSGCYMGQGYESLGGDVTITAEADELVAGVSFNF